MNSQQSGIELVTIRGYKSALRTRSVGRSLIHAEVLGSSFDVLEGPGILRNGLAVVVDRQTAVRGR